MNYSLIRYIYFLFLMKKSVLYITDIGEKNRSIFFYFSISSQSKHWYFWQDRFWLSVISSPSRRRVTGLVFQHQMSGWTMWWWISRERKHWRAHERPGVTDGSRRRQTPPAKGPNDTHLFPLFCWVRTHGRPRNGGCLILETGVWQRLGHSSQIS